MLSISSKTLLLSPEITYRYFFSPASNPEIPTILFLHGFPSTATDFASQLEHLKTAGYGVLAPDLLGYGGTSKPCDVNEYTWKKLSDHIIEILNAESVSTVIGVGHDLGSWFLSRLYHLHPTRFAGLAFLDVGYSAPGNRFDVELINKMTREMTGEERFRYWDFFTSEEGMMLMDQNVESILSLMHASPEIMAANLGPADKTKEWVSQGRVASTQCIGSEDGDLYLREKVAVFREGGWRGPTNWYKALKDNLSWDIEKDMKKELEVPALVLGCGKDEMTVAAFQDQMTRPWAKAGYRFEVVDAGHWVMLDEPGQTNKLLMEFINTIN
ncbi:Bifunctional epoxide hydrolase 2 [Colletotrichum orbiculare MAFF 240422]|uniref:Bifunctional epoxide hydrolase 2 n=1 Tax=Colletotrichum orbiculare (strain 104-T / ATCC 96160 / CBS 514.97 / LARS 414 / MAFF 240422) TaxID=1213857 RepID=N4V116_COLOR|nr:Bifunctional epoxide hydrolase 2 [Colletotrichum orbiculare MAFF 240422]